MTRRFSAVILGVFILVLATACQKEEQAPTTAPSVPKPASGAPAVTVPPPAAGAPAPGGIQPAADYGDQSPPAPPLKENFDGAPKLSLFPRVGDFSPEEDDREKMGYWTTFIDHLVRTSGPVKRDGNQGFAIRGIKTLQSIGFFSPLAVEPGREYRVAFRLWGNIPKGASAGAGILEFNEFMWIGDQFTRSFSQEHLRGSHEGLRLTGKQEGKAQAFTFKSGTQTRMIHLIFFLEGEFERDPIILDDIEIVPVSSR